MRKLLVDLAKTTEQYVDLSVEELAAQQAAAEHWQKEEEARAATEVMNRENLERVKTLASSSAGVRLQELTATQAKALLICLLWRAGAIGEEGRVRPLAEWVRLD